MPPTSSSEKAGISLDYLIKGVEQDAPSSDPLKHLLSVYQKSSPDKRLQIMKIMDILDEM